MARALYTLLWWVALPLIPLRLWWRGRREPGYRTAIGERFGRYANAPPTLRGDVIWVHAVSLGETRAAAPLIERISLTRPQARIVLTSMTASGREAGRALYGDRVLQAWLPYDVPFAVEAFLDRFHPRAGLLIETELWPNLLAGCRRRGVPVFLVNARMSERSSTGYARLPRLTRGMLEALGGVAAQTEADAARLRTLGAHEVVVTGNLKFDLSVHESVIARGLALRQAIGPGRAVWLAASTREGEEALLLDALARAKTSEALLLLVPRHPQRFDEVAELLRSRGVRFVRRSSGEEVPAAARAMLGDTMGEMLAYCAAADVAFVGGSFAPLGGQNLIEPIAVGVPTLVGPHTFNFAEITDRAIEGGAALRVANADALLQTVDSLLADAQRRAQMRGAALDFMTLHRGATDRLWRWLEPKLPHVP